MEIYKLIGAALLGISALFGAHRMNQRAGDVLAQTEAWLSLVRYVRARVDCFSLPAARILSDCDPQLLRACGYEGALPPRGMAELLAGCFIRDGETRRIVESFTREFGKSYREEQIRGCTYCCEQLMGRRDALAGQLPGKKRVNTTLWISGSLALVILFI